MMMLLPFLPAHHLHPIPTFYQEALAAFLGLLALVFLLSKGVRQKIELPEIALLPLGLLLILILQLLFIPGVNTDRLLLFALYLIWASLLLILGRQLILAAGLPQLLRFIATALLLGGLLQCLASALQLAGSPGQPWIAPFQGTFTGNLAQANSFANYLWLAVASAIYLRSVKAVSWPAALAAILLLVFFSSFSGSRSIWLYSPALLLLAGIGLWRQHADPQWRTLVRYTLLTLLLLLFIQIIFGAGLLPLPEHWPQNSGARLAQSGGYDPIRLALWKTALNIFIEHPILGSGIGQFTWQFHQHVLELMPMHLPGLPEHAHNLIFHLMAEMGIGAVLLVLILGGRWLLFFWRTPWQNGHWWLAAILLLILIHSGLEYPLWYSFFLGPFALLLGAGSQRSLSLSIQRIFPLILGGAIILGGVTLLTLQSDYAVLEETINLKFKSTDDKNFQRQYAERLQKIGETSLLSPYVFMVAGNLMADNSEELEHKRKVCNHALRFAATRQIVYKCAHIKALLGREIEAKLALQRALAAYPDHALIVRKEWQQRQAKEPALAKLLAAFPTPTRATTPSVAP